ncbi:bifunctional [glutamine synthetase] adenylyltransferase/[glutamine synthetase]-adenylyl-L-tyrosine phosphorylase [Canibacter zhoujuaniae]|uniref:bifunctional [glutamine synthetase] adenylyltransferase/[glutamine synthetase]-adenylyl-L-tyrosine phosphorylase n=1 Tax=Canibacter zhoujuaniae TaxID=2708343 RepID=UPI00141E0953|nr:bifunctional [glutamine synthetase] adenylyltransferase/[glutamine synthetase]-adenylyl-L-tyrosine phosphorylase [Canibacter zhoujuaniae]
MTVSEQVTLSELARAGFAELSSAREALAELSNLTSTDIRNLLTAFARAGDPDSALRLVREHLERHPGRFSELSGLEWERLALLYGASEGLAQFWQRNPASLLPLLSRGGAIRSAQTYRDELLSAVESGETAAIPVLTPELQQRLRDNPEAWEEPIDRKVRAGEAGWSALRIRYRQLLAEITLADLEAADPTLLFSEVSRALSDLADAALEAAMLVARATLAAGGGSGIPIPAEHARKAPLAVIAMGKCGARELNIVSDVDVLFVTDSAASDIGTDDLLRATTRIAGETMRAIGAPSFEPPLWEVDPNLRPEGKDGALVRTVDSYLNYYDRWAQSWEFQALLKARYSVGDERIGTQFIAAVTPLIWATKDRPDFVGSVRRMRERVTENIDIADIDYQIKLGPGGLRDVEFSVQLLQLVHGAHDESLRLRSTLDALTALVQGGYIARADGEELSNSYRQLRVWEHRLQLRHLRRTALMPREHEPQRVLARTSGYGNAEALVTAWEKIKQRVRSLHIKIFYAPLLSAVAQLQGEDLLLTADAARDRLQSIGFKDPQGALRHLQTLTAGTSRRAQIQRNLLPVLLQWLGEGVNPDAGLLAFRRISEANAEQPWYLRLLRDGTEAAERLTRVLSGSRFGADLLEKMPECVAWLEDDSRLQPLASSAITEEMNALATRRETIEAVVEAVKRVHRREILRLVLSRLVGVTDEKQSAAGLDAAHTALLSVLLTQIQRFTPGADSLRIALIAMGRYGGGELGFASDLDVIAVYGAPEGVEGAASIAQTVVATLRQLVSDPLTGTELDLDLRPEGKNGSLVRNLTGYRNYYEKWSLTWEAQALLRARFVAGDKTLAAEFFEIADAVRYRDSFGSEQLREVRKLKARMETERLPRGAQPRRHLKLGPGGVSDTEWLVQLWQMQHGLKVPALRTVETLAALEAAVQAGICSAADARVLRTAWELASQLRSAIMLWEGRASDTLPTDRHALAGISCILGFDPAHTTELEEAWFSASRRARQVFEEQFFGARL